LLFQIHGYIAILFKFEVEKLEKKMYYTLRDLVGISASIVFGAALFFTILNLYVCNRHNDLKSLGFEMRIIHGAYLDFPVLIPDDIVFCIIRVMLKKLLFFR